MADEQYPYGQEYNPVGNEFNEGYLSDVQGTRGTLKSSDVESVSDVEPASAAPAGEATSEAISGSASFSGGTVAASTAGSGAVVTTTATVVGTGVVIAVGAGLITVTSLFVAVTSFKFDTRPFEREMTYSLTVEYDNDTTIYVSLLNENNEQVAVNEHEIVIADAYDLDEKKFTDIFGTFTDLEYNTNYNIEAYYYAGTAKTILYQTEEAFALEFEPFGLKDLTLKTDPKRKTISITTEVFFNDENQDKDINVLLKDSDDGTVYEYSFYLFKGQDGEMESEGIEYGEDLYGVKNTHVCSDLTSGETYTVLVQYAEYDPETQASVYTDLTTQTILLEESDVYLPYARLLGYNADYETGYVELDYEYWDNGVTYDEYAILVENINWEGTLPEEYQTMRDAPNIASAGGYLITISGPTGYNYKISLCVRNSGDAEYTVLCQSAIYF